LPFSFKEKAVFVGEIFVQQKCLLALFFLQKKKKTNTSYQIREDERQKKEFISFFLS